MAAKNFKRALFTGSLSLALVLPGLPAQALADDVTVVAGIHADAIAMDIEGSSLDLFSYADLPGAKRTKLDPSKAVFHLPNSKDTRVITPKGYEFIAAEGTQIWFAPQTQKSGVIWPGWNTEDITKGEIANDSLVMELVDAQTPENGSVEVFQDSSFGGPTRVWSSDEDFKKYTQPVASHVHANWAFTREGTYTLTFKVTGELVDGTPLEDTQDYTFIVGNLPTDEPASESATPSESAAPSATTQPSASTAPSVEPEPSAPASSKPAGPSTSAAPQPGFADLAQPTPVESSQAPAEGSHDHDHAHDNNQQKAPAAPAPKQAQNNNQNAQVQRPAAPAQNNQNSGAAPVAEKCMATEVLVENAPAKDEKQTAADRASSSRDAVIKTTGLHEATNLRIYTITNSSRQQLTSGHFDFGALLKGESLSASIKDDRTSPAKWVAPGSVEFVLGDAAKKKMPAGMEHVAPAGSDVYLIGGTQEANVPWLGWNTQDSELSKNVEGDVTLKLDSVSGPGKLSVFLTGNFGSAGETVFNAPGDSYKVPLNTHQHGNWVFSAPGEYTANVSWHATLKSGKKVSTPATLHFVVGDVAASGPQATGQKAEQNTSENKAETKQDAKTEQKGSVDTATGIVTRPDGAKVRIVGKTASGADCTLSDSELKDAQQASAAGKLAYTGFSGIQLAGFGVLAVLAGAGTLMLVRRSRQNA